MFGLPIDVETGIAVPEVEETDALIEAEGAEDTPVEAAIEPGFVLIKGLPPIPDNDPPPAVNVVALKEGSIKHKRQKEKKDAKKKPIMKRKKSYEKF